MYVCYHYTSYIFLSFYARPFLILITACQFRLFFSKAFLFLPLTFPGRFCYIIVYRFKPAFKVCVFLSCFLYSVKCFWLSLRFHSRNCCQFLCSVAGKQRFYFVSVPAERVFNFIQPLFLLSSVDMLIQEFESDFCTLPVLFFLLRTADSEIFAFPLPSFLPCCSFLPIGLLPFDNIIITYVRYIVNTYMCVILEFFLIHPIYSAPYPE